MVPLVERFRSGEEDNSTTDEEILNVIRSDDQKVLKTAEIAEELSITQNWTSTRLNQLETKGRVHSKSAGQGRVWWLDEAEPDSYVPESVGDLMWYASEADKAARNVWIMSVGMFIVGGLLLIPIVLFEVFPIIGALPFTSQDFATGAMVAAMGACMFLIGGSFLKLVSLLIQRRFSTA